MWPVSTCRQVPLSASHSRAVVSCRVCGEGRARGKGGGSWGWGLVIRAGARVMGRRGGEGMHRGGKGSKGCRAWPAGAVKSWLGKGSSRRGGGIGAGSSSLPVGARQPAAACRPAPAAYDGTLPQGPPATTRPVPRAHPKACRGVECCRHCGVAPRSWHCCCGPQPSPPPPFAPHPHSSASPPLPPGAPHVRGRDDDVRGADKGARRDPARVPLQHVHALAVLVQVPHARREVVAGRDGEDAVRGDGHVQHVPDLAWCPRGGGEEAERGSGGRRQQHGRLGSGQDTGRATKAAPGCSREMGRG